MSFESDKTTTTDNSLPHETAYSIENNSDLDPLSRSELDEAESNSLQHKKTLSNQPSNSSLPPMLMNNSNNNTSSSSGSGNSSSSGETSGSTASSGWMSGNMSKTDEIELNSKLKHLDKDIVYLDFLFAQNGVDKIAVIVETEKTKVEQALREMANAIFKKLFVQIKGLYFLFNQVKFKIYKLSKLKKFFLKFKIRFNFSSIWILFLFDHFYLLWWN